MKITICSMIGILAVLLPIEAHTDPKSPPTPQRIRITLQVAEVHYKPQIGNASITGPAASLSDVLTKAGGGEATEMSVETLDDVPGVAEYSRVFALPSQVHGKPSFVFMNALSRLKATPHMNPDGSITVFLQTQITEVLTQGAGIAPPTTERSMTVTRTFHSGETLLAGDLLLPGTQSRQLDTASETHELVQYVTVTVVPREKIARQGTGNTAVSPGDH